MADEKEQQQQSEQKEAEQRAAPKGSVVYKAILHEGESELKRSTSALFWSGLAAGLSMGFSMIAEGLLQHRLPDTLWRPLVTKLGYSVGFLIVILGRQQLFTENTLTPILPLLTKWGEKGKLANVLRLWGVVLLANLIGAAIVAWATVRTSAFDAPTRESFLELGRKHLEHGFVTHIVRGIFAGWLIALMVWLLPFAETARVGVIIIITWLVGIGEFSHVIAGAVDVFALAAAGAAGWGQALYHFVLPTFIGNVLGGVTLVAALNHAQITSGEDGDDV